MLWLPGHLLDISRVIDSLCRLRRHLRRVICTHTLALAFHAACMDFQDKSRLKNWPQSIQHPCAVSRWLLKAFLAHDAGMSRRDFGFHISRAGSRLWIYISDQPARQLEAFCRRHGKMQAAVTGVEPTPKSPGPELV